MYLSQLQQLDLPLGTRLTLAALLVALVALDVTVGLRTHRRLTTDLAGTSSAEAERTRTRFLATWIRWGVATALAALLAVTLLPGTSPAFLGLRAPDLTLRGLDGGGSMLAGMVVGLVLAAFLTGLVLRRTGVRLPGGAALDPMLPRTARGRRWWAGLSLSAGVTEEIVYRGLALLTLAATLPGADPRVLVVASALLFGLAHVYQGVTGVLATTAAGWVLAGLYVSTGSLLLPIVLHTLVDLRVLLVRPRDTAPAGVVRLTTGPVPAPSAGTP